jgi:APA family basic amino acid/polyamine antiporter
MVACVAIYILIGVTAVGALHFTGFANSPDPLALILRKIDQPVVATILAVSAVVALPTVLLGFLFGQSRIFFTMARDGLLPEKLAVVSKRGSPVRITVLTAVLVAIIAGVAPIDAIAALANAGTLAAFTAVSVCMLVMRRRAPDAARTFRTPLAPVVGAVAIAGCVYLFFSLPTRTELFFLGWNAIGLVAYFIYGRPRAGRATGEAAA